MARCLIATLGGDAPGTNAVVRAVTTIALKRGMEVFGAKRGWLGLLREEFWRLRESDVASILPRGGSVLGSTDTKIERGDEDSQRRIAEALKKFDLVVVTGGLGSFAVLDRIYDSQDGLGITTTMFVPASVEGEFLNPRHGRPDNTDEVHAESVGADTAGNRAVSAIDCLCDQAFHSRTVFLVECVGSKSNYVPLQVGTACGAHRMYLPLHPRLSSKDREEIRSLYGGEFDPNFVDAKELVAWIGRTFETTGQRYLLVVLPSGVPLLSVRQGGKQPHGVHYEEMITSVKPLELTVLRLVETLDVHFSGRADSVQVRHVLVDDLQRGGPPTLKDRTLGSLYGEAALEEYFAIVNATGIDTTHRGNLNLLAIEGTGRFGWKCIPREGVAHLFQGEDARSGGLDPIPFLRQSLGLVSGYRPLSTL